MRPSGNAHVALSEQMNFFIVHYVLDRFGEIIRTQSLMLDKLEFFALIRFFNLHINPTIRGVVRMA